MCIHFRARDRSSDCCRNVVIFPGKELPAPTLNCSHVNLQIRAIVKNRTCIEDWILEKANHRRRGTGELFRFPYDVGVWDNIREVLNWTCHPIGDGINFRVADGCDQYTLTVNNTKVCISEFIFVVLDGANCTEKRKTPKNKIVQDYTFIVWLLDSYHARFCCLFSSTLH